ncbi:MAG: hypothetical protein A3J65_03705 [Candidatus Buchananbacteria bacterium RIFCSPHIGHO2_02_FULL_45_11b]|uniref:Uncharacterized protein n=4 Tax=Candidatus Buchananiibacteriota TaxID=1817903 RepID=A0A1G1YCP7_9BACT|nr:MAG: hypothetical protein A2663_03445 [Candidatus Buchananbacteria bacterium RIFCSPHIGHO2_01_FULL_46_12]OGY50771.1 MAG: hypothetical protein A3J65_03705 [Candidatus Buchananbacteria bacterium RIFCSPHIGHO2_02_FULL_45_11b]OGY53318.1 MAG: hypothetical protein A3B15_03260 [Candidatus Buchananbacteria bacterium RIFCSPLOWO2_01_FULL_45_31]OGY55764.1 MAG: hypothetical protein A3H67_02600 [Candidatus Buchananbacteria bacterium RIFCSPLOWO2_02_FULL_46_11b]
MSELLNEIVNELENKLKLIKFPSDFSREAELENYILQNIKDLVKEKINIKDETELNKTVYAHGKTKAEKRLWSASKVFQNVIVFGCSNTGDIFIDLKENGTIYIEIKYSKRRNEKSSSLPGDLQRSIGQALIASLRHSHVICFIVCQNKIQKKANDLSIELQDKLLKNNITIIVRSQN